MACHLVLELCLCVTCHAGWSWESLRGWSQFLRLGIPGAAMLGFDWISFEVAAFVLGAIDEVQLALNVIMINLLEFCYMVGLLTLSMCLILHLVILTPASSFQMEFLLLPVFVLGMSLGQASL